MYKYYIIKYIMNNEELKSSIMELKKENEELKEENEDAGGVYSDFKNMKDERDGLKEENKKLKEENKKLKEEREESMTILEEANSDIIGDIKNGITKEKLKEENDKLKFIILDMVEGTPFKVKIEELEEENKKLLKQVEASNDACLSIGADYEKLSDKCANDGLNFGDIVSDLEEQINELKEELEEEKSYLPTIQELKKEIKELKKEISNMKVNNGKYTRLLKDFKVDDANDIFNMIHQLKEEIKELKEKQVWFERNSKFMIDVYEYADDLWKENSEQRPKICVREPHEILSMMKQLKEELKELKQ